MDKVKNKLAFYLSCPNRFLKHMQRYISGHCLRGSLAYNHAGVILDNKRPKDKPAPGCNINEICHPKLIWPIHSTSGDRKSLSMKLTPDIARTVYLIVLFLESSYLTFAEIILLTTRRELLRSLSKAFQSAIGRRSDWQFLANRLDYFDYAMLVDPPFVAGRWCYRCLVKFPPLHFQPTSQRFSTTADHCSDGTDRVALDSTRTRMLFKNLN
jgi:hypothetical protein